MKDVHVGFNLLYWYSGPKILCAHSSQDVMKRQRIFTLSVQQQGSLPWIPEQFFQRKQREIAEDLLYLQQLRQLMAVTTLLQHYVDKASLQAFLQANMYTPFGKRYLCCVQSLYSMIVHRRFHGVELHTFTDLHQGTICCTPRCVCRARCAAPAGGDRRAQISVRLGMAMALTMAVTFFQAEPKIPGLILLMHCCNAVGFVRLHLMILID